VREDFGKGNDFCVKITYRTTGKKPDELLREFRTAMMPLIAVTVDMIATGTDVKPLECLIFMRTIRSRYFFEQVKGRGVRVVSDADLQPVSPGARTKDRFVLVDAVGVTEIDMGESRPFERKKTVSLKALFEQIATGSRDVDIVASIASRLTRLDRQLTKADRAELAELANGTDLHDIAHDLVLAIDIDAAYDVAAQDPETPPTGPTHQNTSVAPRSGRSPPRKLRHPRRQPHRRHPVDRREPDLGAHLPHCRDDHLAVHPPRRAPTDPRHRGSRR